MAPGELITVHFGDQAAPKESAEEVPARDPLEILSNIRRKVEAEVAIKNGFVEPTFTSDDAPALRALKNLAASDLSAFKFEQLVKSVVNKGGTAEDLEQRLHPKAIESLEEFLDQGGNVSANTSDLIKSYCPTKAQLHAENPQLARQYAKLPKVESMQDEWIIANSEFKKPSASAIPFQARRWAFIQNATAQLDEWQQEIEQGLQARIPA